MKTIIVLMDSLNRHMLSVYNKDTWVQTPNIERFAEKSLVFDNHFLGSAPCMPARRDILTGRLNFLDRGWGPVEPFDVTLPDVLKKNDIFSHIVTDHSHYPELGGEGYMQQFCTWDLIRGQERDPWISRVTQPKLPEKYYGIASTQYELNRTTFKADKDYPSPKTFASAIEWLTENKDADNYFLMVEAFDPHEPFDASEEFRQLYPDTYAGDCFEWSTYAPVTEPPEAIEHLQKLYAATLTMTDKWFGKLLDVMDGLDLWDDTLFILTTDHGHLLGEHGFTGKNFMHVYNELAHLPFMVHLPDGSRAGERSEALTQNIDLMPTILDYYGIDIPTSVKGFSLKNIFENKQQKVRDEAIYGWFAMTVNVTDGNYTYFRAPVDDNAPCFAYCGIPVTLKRYMAGMQDAQMGKFLPFTDYPVYKIPVKQGLSGTHHVKDSLLFDILNDYNQENPLDDQEMENVMLHKLIKQMKYADAPSEQYMRLGIV